MKENTMKQLIKKAKKVSIYIMAIIYLGCTNVENIFPTVTSGFTYTMNENTGTVTFINISTEAKNYLWNFGDGETSTEINPIKTFASGTYTVALKASNDAGASDTFEDEITLNIFEEGTMVMLPITFDDDNVDYSVTVFEGATFNIVDNPDVSGTNDKASKVGEIINSGAEFEGFFFDLGTDIDLTTNKTITMNFWADVVVDVLVKLEEGTGDAIEVSASHGGTGWEALSFDFTSSESYSRLTIFVNGPGTTAGTYYIDDIEQTDGNTGGGGECSAETVQSLSAADFNLTFQTDPTASIDSFDAGLTWVSNPDSDNDVNSSCQVGQIDRDGSALFANNQIDLDAKLDFSANAGFTMKVWSPVAGTNVLVKLEDQANAGTFTEIGATTNTASAWEELTFPFASSENGKYDKIILFFELNTNTTETYYIDDFALYAREGSGGGTGEGNLITNGGFETGDNSGWETAIAGNSGTFAVTSTSAKCGTYSANIAVNESQSQTIRQANMGVGIVTPNSDITVSFDIRGLTGVGGEFIAILFSESSTEGVTKTDVLGPIEPSDSWTRYTFNTTTGNDVSNGVSLLLQSVCGAVGGCELNAYIDNVFVGPGTEGPECVGGSDTGGGDDTEAPNAITDLTASNTTATTTALGWTAPTDNVGVTNYEVFQDGISIATTGAATTYNVSGLSPLTTYAFTIFAKDAAGNVSVVSNTANITTLDGSTGGDNLAINGDFETGDISGWTTLVDADGATFTVTSSEAACGTFSGNLVADFEAGVGGPVDAIIKQANIGVGIVTPNSQVTISFDLRGSLAGAGGVFFAEIFSEVSGGGTSKSEILSGGPLFPTDIWTRYSYTVTTGNDVSGGVTLQLKSSVGPNPGSLVDAFIDNVFIGMGTTSGPDCAGTGTGGNGAAGLNFESTSVTVNEDAGTATFTARLNGDVPGGFTVEYATADGSAVQPDDYTSTSGTLTFVGTNGESYDIVVPIVDDGLDENQENFVVNLSNISNTTIAINTPQASGNIIDNDGAGVELAENGDFETGTLDGWAVYTNGGSITADNTQSNGGTWSAKLIADPSGLNPTLKQERKGAGTISAGDTVQITFDYMGSLAGESGTYSIQSFVEATNGVNQTEIFSVTPTSTWQTFTATYTVNAGDVGGGITMEFTAICGGVPGCNSTLSLDNVSMVINP